MWLAKGLPSMKTIRCLRIESVRSAVVDERTDEEVVAIRPGKPGRQSGRWLDTPHAFAGMRSRGTHDERKVAAREHRLDRRLAGADRRQRSHG